ncbi:MAG: recombinase RecA [Selenomonadaceae bacterium]|nr:recombinase RecA [Selenomonadaceae bacterium]MBP3722979.1 recombinase RecA [Selenomonadaceae bacterium]
MDKSEALLNALKQIEKNFGKGSVMRLGDNASMNVDSISTGVLPLDIALGIGGIPKGRITELFGPESSGKTTIALHIIAEAQKAGGTAAFIDAEHALDPTYAQKLGVHLEDLLVSQPDDGEQALDITEVLISSGAVDLIVVDSVAALVPRAEIEGEMGDSNVGLQARLMSKAMRKLTGIVSKTGTSVVFINQIREKVGVLFGSPETTTGGRALKFFASVRIDIRKGEPLKNGAEIIGNHTKAKIVKNKVAPPFKTAEFDIMYGEGVSRLATIIDMGVNYDIIEKSGAWFSYGGTRMGQGKENAKAFLANNLEVALEIEDKIRAAVMKKQEEDAKAITEEQEKKEAAYKAAMEQKNAKAAEAKPAETEVKDAKKKKKTAKADEEAEEVAEDERSDVE